MFQRRLLVRLDFDAQILKVLAPLASYMIGLMDQAHQALMSRLAEMVERDQVDR
jgi:hypothetical protein